MIRVAEKNLEAVRKSFSRQAAGLDDPSRNFSRADYLQHLVEVLELGGDEHVLEVASVEVTPVEQRLEPWLELTGTPDHDAREISRSLHAELAGGSPTGFSPFFRDGEIWFWQQWRMMVARKSA